MESIEASGKSVDEAVQQALARLGKRRDEVEVTVLQEASRGTFGLGSKEARVRVTARPGPISAVITPEMADAILGTDDEELYPVEVEDEEELEDEDELEEEELEDDDELEDDEEFEDDDEEFDEDEDEFEEDELEEGEPVAFMGAADLSQEQLAFTGDDVSVAEGELQDVEKPSREDIEVTVDVLQHVLHYMNIHATVQVRSTEPLTLNIHGIHDNLGLLIGRRGETLSALQLLVNLIVSHRTRHRMRIIVDAENYRQRREENLRSLALRVAQQVRNYRRSIALEAMPPHERRIVHIALSDSKDISTESIGEGDERRVVISLKRPGR